MDTLVALGVLSAYLYSVFITLRGGGATYFDSAAMVVEFILIGRYLETTGGAQARKDLRSLLRLQPEFAWSREGHDRLPPDVAQPDGPVIDWRKVRVETLAVGDEFLVKPGERVPVDARVLEGSASLDESLLTGESLPVTKQVGDAVFAGAILQEGALICQVTHPSGSTRLSKFADLVSQTLSQKPRIQRLADQASTYFAYGILLLALTTFVGWYLRTHSVSLALMTAVAVLVVACPCALGLATPLVMAVAMGSAARRGILVRSPQALETSTSIRRLVFDKTGTLTSGQLAVVDAVPADGSGFDRDGLLLLAASVEQFSEHPLARAIVRSNPAPVLPASEFMSLRGIGASARVEIGAAAQRVSVGSQVLSNPSQSPELLKIANQHASRGETVVWVDRDGQTDGFIALRDQLNPTAREALKQLSGSGIETTMLSGDSPLAAQAIAHELGIDAFDGNVI
jgi:Cu+-exporting ATPase